LHSLSTPLNPLCYLSLEKGLSQYTMSWPVNWAKHYRVVKNQIWLKKVVTALGLGESKNMQSKTCTRPQRPQRSCYANSLSLKFPLTWKFTNCDISRPPVVARSRSSYPWRPSKFGTFCSLSTSCSWTCVNILNIMPHHPSSRLTVKRLVQFSWQNNKQHSERPEVFNTNWLWAKTSALTWTCLSWRKYLIGKGRENILVLLHNHPDSH